MDKLINSLIPAVITLFLGIIFLFGRDAIVKMVLGSHTRFWKETLKLSGEVNTFSQLFLKGMILLLGLGFIVASVFLIYRYFQR